MKKYLIMSLAAGLVACSGMKENGNHECCSTGIQGQWAIENVVENDSSYVRPSEIAPGVTAYIDFRDDNTFGIMTNCNHIGGQYVQTNDSIKLTDIYATEMACDNMDIEDMLRKVLPMVSTIDCINDSITRLNSETSSYIVLHKMQQPVK